MNSSLPLHIVTGHFPPMHGGVADYAYLLADELARQGQAVVVWCCSAGPSEEGLAENLIVYRPASAFNIAGIFALHRAFQRHGGRRRIVVQWTPQLYGWKSMNLLFCFWILLRGLVYRDRVELIVHELFLPMIGSIRHRIVGLIQRAGVSMLLLASTKIWTSTSAWTPPIKSYLFGRTIPIEWLTIPSCIRTHNDATAVANIRARYASQHIVGHFGTCGRLITALLEPILLSAIQSMPGAVFLLFGKGTDRWVADFTAKNPTSRGNVIGLGELANEEISLHLQACDVLLQPYPDGITTRRGTTMAGLAHGCCIVTNSGALTEPFWSEERGLVLLDAFDVPQYVAHLQALIADPAHRSNVQHHAQELYSSRFTMPLIARRLREDYQTSAMASANRASLSESP